VALRLLLVSQGDAATLAVLAQNLDITTIFVATLVASLFIMLYVVSLLLVTEEGALLPSFRGPGLRRLVLVLTAALVVSMDVSWRLALLWVIAFAVFVGLEYLARWLSRRAGGTGSGRLVEPVVFVFIILSSVVLMGPWLPTDRITLSDNSIRVGYVVSTGDPMTVLWREGGVVYLKPSDFKARQLCSEGSSGPSILSLGKDVTPPCPSAKVSHTGS
jgi:hypothetical protein